MYVTTGVGLILVAAIIEKYDERKRDKDLKTAEIDNNNEEKAD
jgi:hypothetical protein